MACAVEQKQIGNKIRELRIQRGLTQAELGQKVGVSMQAVSKWERGGTPDIEVLLSIAQYFNVTMDELLGRCVRDPNNLENQIYDTLQQAPEESRVEQATRYCWAALKGMSNIPCIRDLGYKEGNIRDPENSRSRIAFNEGIGYAMAYKDAHMVAIMPTPADDFDFLFDNIEHYTELFRLLADRDAFKLFLFVCTRAQALFSIRLVAQSTGISEARIKKIFDVFLANDWLLRETADIEEGSITLYRQNCKESFLFFLLFANEVIIRPRFWYLSSTTTRVKPFLSQFSREEHSPEDSEPELSTDSTGN